MSTDNITPRQAREQAGLTQEQLAAASGLSVSTIVRTERRGTWPRWPSTRRMMLDALGLLTSEEHTDGH